MFRNRAIVVVAILLIIAVHFLFASGPENSTKNAVQTIEAVDLGGGVFRFDIYIWKGRNTDIWEQSLVKFVKNHPDLRITAIFAKGQDGLGVATGILVVTEKRK